MFAPEKFVVTAINIDFLQIEGLKKNLLNAVENHCNEILAETNFNDFKILPSEYTQKMFMEMKSAMLMCRHMHIPTNIAIGMIVDCRDSDGKWYESNILDVRSVDKNLQILVRSVDKNLQILDRWNEWIDWDSSRRGKNFEKEKDGGLS